MESIMELFSLKDHVCVVTGGAQGLGLAMAEALADAGGAIVLADLNQSLAKEQAARIAAEKGVRTAAFRTDVTNPDSVQRLVETTVAEFGHIDVLMNNAGICHHAPAEDVEYNNWLKVIDVNLNGVFLVAQAVGKQMIRQGKGSIVNTSSMSAMIVNTPQGQVAYNASKAAVSHLTHSLATEWAMKGVRVNAIAPGYMKTDMTAPIFAAGGEWVNTWMAMSPTKRPGEPFELGGLAVYLASDASSFTNGAVIPVDGGYTCW